MADQYSNFPSNLKDVFDKLSSGYHLCIEDGDAFKDISENTGYYRELFKLLGYKLSDGADGLYYFFPSDEKINEISKRLTAFMAVMYDWLADQGKEPVSSLTEQHFHFDQLPHLNIDQYRKIMAQLEINDSAALLKIVQSLQKYGFLMLADGALIKFRKPVKRFVSMFTEVADSHDKKNYPVDKDA
jgi:hypothetical protein